MVSACIVRAVVATSYPTHFYMQESSVIISLGSYYLVSEKRLAQGFLFIIIIIFILDQFIIVEMLAEGIVEDFREYILKCDLSSSSHHHTFFFLFYLEWGYN